MLVANIIKTFHYMKRHILKSLQVNALNERIKQARERAGLTVNKAAELLGVKRIQIWRMENQDYSLSAKRLYELSDHYGVDPQKLFLGETGEDTRFDRIGDVVAFV